MKITTAILGSLFILYIVYCIWKDRQPPQLQSQKLWEEQKRKEREEFIAQYRNDHPDFNNTGHAGEA